LDIRLARRLTDLPVSREQWNALAGATPGATLFQTYEWFQCWWNAFGAGKELFCATIWEDGSLLGIVPLMRFRRYGIRHLEFVGSPNGDYQDFILGDRSAALLPEIARFLYAERGQWDTLVLRNLPMESPTHHALPGLMRDAGLHATDLERVACPTLQLASRGEATHKLIDRYSIRRRIKAMRQRGEISFRRITTKQELEAHLPQFFEQYVERRRGSPAARTFLRADVRDFFERLSDAMLTAGWLHFSALALDGHPAAYHLGFEYRGRLYWYKPSFDPALRSLSPGLVLLHFLIRDAVERHLDELDFTVGAEPFKYRYSNAERTNANVRVFRSRIHYATFLAVARLRGTASRLRRATRPD